MEKEIITREEADVLGLTRYFTGRACRNNHIADRYVNGGACVECINGDKIITDAQRETRVAERQAKIDMERRRIELAEQRLKQRQAEQAERLELARQRAERQEKEVVIKDENRAVRGVSTAAKSELIKMGFEIASYDLPALKSFVHGLALLRVPGIRMIDIYPNVIPKYRSGPCYFYYFMVHPEDRELVFHAAETLMKPLADAARTQRLARLPEMERNLEKLRREQQEDNNGDPGDTLENLRK